MPLFVDHSGRSAGPGALVVRGVVVLVVLVLGLVTLMKYSAGDFEDRFTLTIESAEVGDGLMVGADVKMRGYGVGRVTGIDTLAGGRQEIKVEIDPRQARVLSNEITTAYSSSNLFGSTAIDLIDRGGPQRLPNGSTLQIEGDGSDGTVTGVLRKASSITSVLNSNSVGQFLTTISDNAGTLAQAIRAALPLAASIVGNQKLTIGEFMTIFADTIDGVRTLLGPLVSLLEGVMDAATFMADPKLRDKTIKATRGLSEKLVTGIGDILVPNQDGLAKLIDGLLDVAVPVVLSLGTIPNSYQRIPELINQTGDAFKTVDGNQQLQVQILLQNLPQLSGPASARSGTGAEPAARPNGEVGNG